MLKNQNNISDFMKMAGQNIPVIPTISDENTRKLRIKLILEELVELSDASGFDFSIVENHHLIKLEKDLSNIILLSNGKEPNLVEMADAIADLDYVNTGAAVAFGLDLEELHNEVHASNMSKLWTEEEINKLINGDDVLRWNGTDEIEFHNGETFKIKLLKPELERKCGVFYNGKLKKSPSYIKADLKKIIYK